ncbi:hypothetical protein BMF94_0047 [Rhodotorula taiwanensis]|uniref:Uncharacterized protein n=1 Tax=Rhodotorula taiwanensis TaxID=741276 RepID=A0A2S5BJ51_9BASI|nr:hypothetical protein BMF94_0047 [Rhodotorula taiwanensis]
MPAALELDEPVLERIFTFASSPVGPLDWHQCPDYGTLKACALVCPPWRYPAQSILAKHVRIASPEAMAAIRTREAKRQLAQHTTLVLESINQFGHDTYWLLDRFPKLEAFRIDYDVQRGGDGQAERDDEWLTWDVLRHPSLVGNRDKTLTPVKDLFCKADFQEPDDTSLLSFPVTRLALGCLPLEHAPALHKALFTGCKATLQDISLDFRPTADKDGLENLIAEFQAGVALTLEHLHFLNKPNINFLMSMHSKMNASKMPRFYSVSYPLLPNALAPFNILALAVVNNGTALVEFGLVEPPYLPLVSNEDHEALVLRYIAAFGSRLDSFNMMGRRFRFRFPREWPARFVRLPEIARFLDRAGARGCDVWCGAEQKFESTAKAMEKRKGKRVANGSSGADADEDEEQDGPAAPTLAQLQQFLAHGTLPSSSAAPPRRTLPPPAPEPRASPNGTKGKGKGKAVDTKGKRKAVDTKGKRKAKEQ